MLKENPGGTNSIQCQKYVNTEDHIELKLCQFSVSPSSILGVTENATFHEEIHALKTGFLLDY